MLFYHSYVYMSFMKRIWAYESLEGEDLILCFSVRELGE